jgi:hypothetical protein
VGKVPPSTETGTLYSARPRRRWPRWVAVSALLAVGGGVVGWFYRQSLLDLYADWRGGEVLVLLDVVPRGARVFLDGVEVESRTLQLRRSKQTFVIRVDAKGHVSQTLTVVADRTQTHRVVLQRSSRVRPTRPARPAGARGRCPRGMRLIEAKSEEGYCIDRYEHPGQGKTPQHGVTLAQARATCHARGARLCSVEEWMGACGGRFPYGETYQAGRCNTGGAQLVAAGVRRGCASRSGVFDLSGNVSEWVEDGVAMGGDARQEQGLTACSSSSDRGGELTGFRCCADLPWD